MSASTKNDNLIFYKPTMLYSNTGDILIHKALVDTLREFGQLQCYVGKDIPSHIIESLKLHATEKIDKKYGTDNFFLIVLITGASNLLKRKKVYYFCGVGHVFGGDIKGAISQLGAAGGLGLMKLVGIKTARLGFSFGPVTQALGLASKVRSWVTDLYSVRDQASLEYSRKYFINKAFYSPDLSWSYLFRENSTKKKDGVVYLSFREDLLYHSSSNEYAAGLVKAIREILLIFQKKNDKMKVRIGYQTEADKHFSDELYREFKNDFDVEILTEQITVDGVEHLYDDVEYVLSNRMHVLLFAYKSGALPVPVTDKSGHTKVVSVFMESGLDDLIVDIAQPVSISQIENIQTNKENYLDSLKNLEKKNFTETREVLAQFIK